MKLKELKDILNYCTSTCKYVFYEIDELNDFSKLGYNIDEDGEEEEKGEI